MEPDLIPASEMKTIFPGTSDQYWASLRHKGGGPEYVKVGPPGRARKVYYRQTDIAAWVEGSRYTRTDRPVNA